MYNRGCYRSYSYLDYGAIAKGKLFFSQGQVRVGRGVSITNERIICELAQYYGQPIKYFHNDIAYLTMLVMFNEMQYLKQTERYEQTQMLINAFVCGKSEAP